MIAVGIDPGINTGVAVWDCKEQKFLMLETMSFWTTFTYVTVDLGSNYEKLIAVIEDPNQNKPVFPRRLTMKEVKIKLKIAQDVGQNKKEAGLLIEGFRRYGIPVKTVRPTKSKLDAGQFKQMTGYKGRTNEHTRDSGRLVYGTPEMPDKQFQQIYKEN